MQIELVDAFDGIILAPAICGAVGAADDEPVQHGEEHRALQREAELARACQLRDHRSAAGLLPQPLEQQRRSDATYRDLDRGVIAGRAQHHRLGGKARRAHSRSSWPLACNSSKRQASRSPAGAPGRVAAALDDLQIVAPGSCGGIHGGGRCWCAHGMHWEQISFRHEEDARHGDAGREQDALWRPQRAAALGRLPDHRHHDGDGDLPLSRLWRLADRRSTPTRPSSASPTSSSTPSRTTCTAAGGRSSACSAPPSWCSPKPSSRSRC